MPIVTSTRGSPSLSNVPRAVAGDELHAATHAASRTAADTRADRMIISMNRRVFLKAAGAGALGLSLRQRDLLAADVRAAGTTLQRHPAHGSLAAAAPKSA